MRRDDSPDRGQEGMRAPRNSSAAFAARRVVFAAVLQMMRAHALTEDDAFGLIRSCTTGRRSSNDALTLSRPEAC